MLIHDYHDNIFPDNKVNQLIKDILNGDTSRLDELLFESGKEPYALGNSGKLYRYDEKLYVWKEDGSIEKFCQETLSAYFKDAMVSYFGQRRKSDHFKIQCEKRIVTIDEEIRNKTEEIVKNSHRDFLRHHPNIENQFDNNSYFVDFTNGVYDLREGFLKPAIFYDYMSLSTGYDLPKYDEEDESIKLLRRLAGSLHSQEEFGEITVIYSEYQNNLHLLIFLIKLALGDTAFENNQVSEYAKTDPSNYLFNTPYNSIDRKSPEWLSLRGKRFVLACSFDDDNLIIDKDAVKKNIEDWHPAALYSEQYDDINLNNLFVPQFSLFAYCDNENDIRLNNMTSSSLSSDPNAHAERLAQMSQKMTMDAQNISNTLRNVDPNQIAQNLGATSDLLNPQTTSAAGTDSSSDSKSESAPNENDPTTKSTDATT
ncbi:hypothetical protein BDK51DRAFT_36632 [Blyttiomyces helicus]|uniref:Bacteriophage/plasmid primase P4 C-terminal domain-containing protein n=1 Tax=Blyttiomyces helicus TaxID=388810 RepID=A0A4P9WAP9_9FUNG|nr:hypothetical protein BDK51DRAFT_36632 [Blyttiomyces helicus]|eukprot:RKO89679.1 hypothetical protein BDK51DRAFT_36632 [Blyttiomyces helicus]